MTFPFKDVMRSRRGLFFCRAFGGTSKNLERIGKFLKYFVLVSGTEGVKKLWDAKPKDNQNNTLNFH